MKPVLCAIIAVTLLLSTISTPAQAGFFDDLTAVLGGAEAGPGSALDDSTITRGLKEALATGTARAVKAVSRRDGYFGNEMIRILLPEKVRSTAELLGRFGFQQEVDDFVLSMNRAAEKAAPGAAELFAEALTAMTFDDARAILQGGKTSATEYFRRKTGDSIYSAFKPVVTANMKEVGVARTYSQMVDKVGTIPFAGAVGSVGAVRSFDLDHYVTTRAVDGLFSMLGEEEIKIRTNPAARGTELLKKVFAR